MKIERTENFWKAEELSGKKGGIVAIRAEKGKFGELRADVMVAGETALLSIFNPNALIAAFGDDSDTWIGREVSFVIEEKVNAKGKDTIRLKVLPA